ncbi:kinase-like protein [Glonium stellatum]|uniref:Kinase-like protein n=1 Tax=Glonium stellatum TaxID=574774 RepID=A0A8E2EMC2_9PEZI|nr:kinase-like protein [Glonium stellatum]
MLCVEEVDNCSDESRQSRMKRFDADTRAELDHRIVRTSASWSIGRPEEATLRNSSSTSDLVRFQLKACQKSTENVDCVSTVHSISEASVKTHHTLTPSNSLFLGTTGYHRKKRTVYTRLKGLVQRDSMCGLVREDPRNGLGKSEIPDGRNRYSKILPITAECRDLGDFRMNPPNDWPVGRFCESYYAFIAYFVLYDPKTSHFWPPNEFFPLLTNNQMIDLGLDLLSEIQRRKDIYAAHLSWLPEIRDFVKCTSVPIRVLCRLSDERLYHLRVGFCSEFIRTKESGIRANIIKFYPKIMSLTSEQTIMPHASLDYENTQSISEVKSPINLTLQHPVGDTGSSQPGLDHNIGIAGPPFLNRSLKQVSKAQDLIGPLQNSFNEKDWSGRGQHAEFDPDEKHKLRRILQFDSVLGTTKNALVESVKCKRILLARKTIRCSHRISRETAIKEVVHLQRLEHFHIVQLIGTYVMGNDIAILLYPVTEFNLETFIQSITDLSDQNASGEAYQSLTKADKREPILRRQSLATSFRCLSNALKYIHEKITKHMDIKPQNILVRDTRASRSSNTPAYKIYIADFGIARSYASQEESETEGPTSFTRKYAAPEVVDWDRRGLAADIFSLGCVFAEMLAALAPNDPVDQIQQLKSIRSSDENDSSYQANIQRVQKWLFNLPLDQPAYFPVALVSPLVSEMINFNPAQRPSAERVARSFGASEYCCTKTTGREPLEAMKEDNQEMHDAGPSTVKGPFGRVLAMIKE